MGLPIRWESAVIEERPCFRLRELDVVEAPEPEQQESGKAPAMMPIARMVLMLAMAVSAAALLAVGMYALRLGESRPGNLRVLAPDSKNSSVAIASVTAARSPGFVSVTGTVANRTPQDLSNVEAVVELVDGNSRVVTQDAALINSDALPAGRTAPFRVEVKDNAQAVVCRVHFRKLMGASLN